MKKTNTILKTLGWMAVIGIPVAGLAIYSSRASAKEKDALLAAEFKPDEVVPADVIAAINAVRGTADLPDVDENLNPIGPMEHVGWWLYRGKWIKVEEFPGTGTVEEDSAFTHGPLSREYIYKGRFRWIVMHSGSPDSPPFGIGEATGEGSAVMPAPTADGVVAARKAAAQAAADAGAAWLDIVIDGSA